MRLQVHQINLSKFGWLAPVIGLLVLALGGLLLALALTVGAVFAIGRSLLGVFGSLLGGAQPERQGVGEERKPGSIWANILKNLFSTKSAPGEKPEQENRETRMIALEKDEKGQWR